MNDDLVPPIAGLLCGLLLLSGALVTGFVITRNSTSKTGHLPYLPSIVPVFGNTFELARNLDRYHDWLVAHALKRDGQPFALHLLGKNDVLYLSRPEHFEEILKTQSGHFSKSDSVRDIFDDFLGESVVLTNGESWQLQRKTLATLLTMRALREYMTPIIQEKALLLRGILLDASQSPSKQPVDAYKLVRQFTLDTFVKIGFGCNLNLLASGKEHPFEGAFDDANRISSERFTKPTWLWKIQRWLNIGSEKRLRESINAMNQFMMNLISSAIDRVKQLKGENTDGEIPHKNIMEILLSKTQTMTPTEVRDITLTGLEAGRNTTADTLVWLFHALSQNPRVEMKLRDEIMKNLPGFREAESYVPSYEDIQRVSYLEAVSREVLRLYPSVPVIPYHCHSDTVLDGSTFIPAGTDVFLNLFAAGRVPSVWGSDAASFVPERFIDESTGELLAQPPVNYSPFSAGRRSCLGKNLAMTELKIVVATVVNYFRLVEVTGQDVQPILDLTLGMKNPLMMHVERVN